MPFDDMTYVDEPFPTSTGATGLGDDGYIDDQFTYSSSTGATMAGATSTRAAMAGATSTGAAIDDGFLYTSSTPGAM
jgi:hypothetical protein